jgi:hypothetical protein
LSQFKNHKALSASNVSVGLKVGDMPQRSTSLAVSVFPIQGLKFQAILNSYKDHYADWDPLSRQVNDWGDDGLEKDDYNNDGDYDDENDVAPDNGEADGIVSAMEMSYADREESWMAPAYSKMDIHISYDIPLNPMILGGVKVQAFLHIFNLFDQNPCLFFFNNPLSFCRSSRNLQWRLSILPISLVQ